MTDYDFSGIISRIEGSKTSLVSVKRAPKSSHDVRFIRYSHRDSEKEVAIKMEPANRYPYKNYEPYTEGGLLMQIQDSFSFSVPKVVYLNRDDTVYGKEFFIMEKIGGKKILETGTSEKDSIETLIDALTEIHNIRPEQVKKRKTSDMILHKIDQLNKYLNLKSESEYDKVYIEGLAKMRNRCPKDEACVLLHGDIGIDDLFIHNGKRYILDWDAACYGDPSWDIWWGLKGGISENLWGTNFSPEDFIEMYESKANEKLKNSEYFMFGSLLYAYALGIFLERFNPEHTAIPNIKKKRSAIIEKIIEMM